MLVFKNLEYKKPFYRAGQLLTLVSLLFFGLGCLTYFFAETSGNLTKNSQKAVLLKGGYVGIPHVPTPQSKSIVDYDIEYSYAVSGLEYKGSMIGFGMNALTLSPFNKMEWEKKTEKGELLTVYYFPSIPSVSVLYVGVDWLVSITLLTLGLALIRFSKWIHRNEYKR